MTQSNITNKEKELLTLFPQFRFLTRFHIQQFLNHKDKKTIQTWINDLTEKGYIRKVEKEDTKQFPPKPVVYYLGKNGRRFIQELETYPEQFLRNLYYDNNRSDSFIHTNLLIADICIDLRKQNTPTEIFSYITKVDYMNPDSDYHFLLELHPHLLFTKKTKGRKIIWYLLEIFPFLFPNEEIRRRIHAYVKFLKDKAWDYSCFTTEPVILFICMSKEMQRYIRQYVKKKLKHYDIDDYNISIALEENVRSQGVRGNIWDEV